MRLDWQRRAVILFAASLLILSIVLVFFAVREAEREKLLKEREIEGAQQRLVETIDGRAGSLVSETEIRVLEAVKEARANVEPARDPRQLEFVPTGGNGTPAWSPDGRKLIGDRALSPKGSKQSLFTVPEAGGPVKEINLGKRLPPRSEIRTPDCSPDGKTIIFTLRSSISEVSLFQRGAAMPPSRV